MRILTALSMVLLSLQLVPVVVATELRISLPTGSDQETVFETLFNESGTAFRHGFVESSFQLGDQVITDFTPLLSHQLYDPDFDLDQVVRENRLLMLEQLRSSSTQYDFEELDLDEAELQLLSMPMSYHTVTINKERDQGLFPPQAAVPNFTASCPVSGNTNWVPNYTDVSFFDTDEVGYYPYSNWLDLGGNAYSAVAIAYHWGRLRLMMRGSDDALWSGTMSSDGAFSGWAKISGTKTYSAPALASWNGRLYQGHRGTDNKIYLRYSADDGVTWTSWSNNSLRTTSTAFSMAVASDNNRLCVFHKGETNNKMYMGCTADGNSWSDWKEAPGETYDQPVAASAFGFRYQAHRGTDSKIYVRYSADKGSTWTGWTAVQSSVTKTYSSFGMRAYNNQLCLLHRGIDNYMYQSCINSASMSWPSWQRQSGETTSAPALASDVDVLAQGHRGTNNRVYVRFLRKSPGSRGYFSNVKWNSPVFDYYGSYEQEITLYKDSATGYTTYLTRDQDSSCIPVTKYLASNLPTPYLDTRMDFTSCGSDTEVQYVIGSAFANKIVANVMYFTYYVASKGDNKQPVLKVAGQVGHRGTPEGLGCGYVDSCSASSWTWCVWPEATTFLIGRTTPNQSTAWPYWYAQYGRY